MKTWYRTSNYLSLVLFLFIAIVSGLFFFVFLSTSSSAALDQLGQALFGIIGEVYMPFATQIIFGLIFLNGLCASVVGWYKHVGKRGGLIFTLHLLGTIAGAALFYLPLFMIAAASSYIFW